MLCCLHAEKVKSSSLQNCSRPVCLLRQLWRSHRQHDVLLPRGGHRHRESQSRY